MRIQRKKIEHTALDQHVTYQDSPPPRKGDPLPSERRKPAPAKITPPLPKVARPPAKPPVTTPPPITSSPPPVQTRDKKHWESELPLFSKFLDKFENLETDIVEEVLFNVNKKIDDKIKEKKLTVDKTVVEQQIVDFFANYNFNDILGIRNSKTENEFVPGILENIERTLPPPPQPEYIDTSKMTPDQLKASHRTLEGQLKKYRPPQISSDLLNYQKYIEPILAQFDGIKKQFTEAVNKNDFVSVKNLAEQYFHVEFREDAKAQSKGVFRFAITNDGKAEDITLKLNLAAPPKASTEASHFPIIRK